MTHESTNADDVALEIAEALSRTGIAKESATGVPTAYDEYIGSVPHELRHLHNLLTEIIDKVAEGQAIWMSDQLFGIENHDVQAHRTNLARYRAVETHFYNALWAHIPKPLDNLAVVILKNWDVVSRPRMTDDEVDPTGILGAIRKTLAERRHH
jgi:hypothetical protein